MHGDGPRPIGLGCQNIARCVAHEGNRGVPRNPSLLPRMTDSQASQASPVPSHLREGAKAEVAPQPTALHLAPPDPGEVARHQSQRNAALLESAEKLKHSGADLL